MLLLTTAWHFSSINFFARNFIRVLFSLSSFKKKKKKPFKRFKTIPAEASIRLEKSEETFCMLLLAIIASSYDISYFLQNPGIF